LSDDDIGNILVQALKDADRGLGRFKLSLSSDANELLVRIAGGDARVALTSLEIAAVLARADKKKTDSKHTLKILPEHIEKALQEKPLLYDKTGEEHYNLISAFHKSLRGSDPDAAIYWLGRMLIAGEDPLYVARRMVRFASEDIGNADPQALTVTMSAMEAFRFLGHPDGELALAQAVVYLATAPKSNSTYAAYGNVKETVKETGTLSAPLHIRNAPTPLMKDLGYGKDYKYAHEYKDAFVPQEYLPEQLAGRLFYHPTNRGYEKIIKQRLDAWRKLKEDSKKEK